LIPRKRQGSYFPSFLEPRRRSEQAIVAVVLEAYVNGVSTRKVDRLVEQLGIEGVASTVTAWFAHTVGFESLGVLSDTPTGSLSTSSVSGIDDCVGGPAALVAWRVKGICLRR
jgi:hypothetical protein